MKTLYATIVTVEGGRNGHAISDDGILNMDLSMPKSLGGHGNKSNPEQLFAAGYAACFQGALMLVASKQQKDASKSRVKAYVELQQEPEGGFAIGVRLEASIPGMPMAEVEKLLKDAHQVCPYSKLLRKGMEVKVDAVESL